MDLSDYDILGIKIDDDFRTAKNAYYELSKIYHPDSHFNQLSKEDKIVSFKIIQKAYSNIKQKLNIDEIDAPKHEINYSDDLNIKFNNDIKNLDSFNKKFEEIHSKQCEDEPFSIYYKLPEKEKRIDDSKIIIKQRDYLNNKYEFGVNYVSDYTGEYYTDIKYEQESISHCSDSGDDSGDDSDYHSDTDSVNELKSQELELKLNELIELRNTKIELNKTEKEYIKNQNKYIHELQQSKNIIQESRNKLLLNNK